MNDKEDLKSQNSENELVNMKKVGLKKKGLSEKMTEKSQKQMNECIFPKPVQKHSSWFGQYSKNCERIIETFTFLYFLLFILKLKLTFKLIICKS